MSIKMKRGLASRTAKGRAGRRQALAVLILGCGLTALIGCVPMAATPAGASSGVQSSSTPGSSQSISFVAPFVPLRTVTVCALGCDFALPSQAIAAARDYDLIRIAAGDYVDCATVNGNGVSPHVWLQGFGGAMPHLRDQTCARKGILVIDGTDVTIDNIEFSGMAVSAADGNNGAGIRAETGSLTVRNCFFHDGQEGILGGPDGSGAIHVLNSHFARLGVDGFEHDLYINHVADFVLQNSIVEQGYQGNVVKSRARKALIQCNRIVNGIDSAFVKNGYLIDLSNGGDITISNNVIAQGAYNGGQQTFISFAAEGLNNPTQALALSGNIFLNDLGAGTILTLFQAPTANAQLTGNTFVGGGSSSGGAFGTATTESGSRVFANRAAAGFDSEFPIPAACVEPLGPVAVP